MNTQANIYEQSTSKKSINQIIVHMIYQKSLKFIEMKSISLYGSESLAIL